MVHVVAIRRYPVKSMGGETLERVTLDARGLVGDRAFAVRDADSRLASGKNSGRMVRRDGVFAYSARTGPDAVVVSDGEHEWAAGDPALDAELTRALAADVRVAAETDVPHFDGGAVSLVGTATLAWCARELGVDPDARRLRVSLVVETEEPFEEESWAGEVVVGAGAPSGAVLRPVERIQRCRTIDLPQDGVASQTRWLVPLGRSRDTRVGIYCDVALPGTISVGDEVRAL